jgi:hypothetical protein
MGAQLKDATKKLKKSEKEKKEIAAKFEDQKRKLDWL